MKNFIPGSNPKLMSLPKGKRHVSATEIKPLIIGDIRYCAWCSVNETEKNKKYCSERCQESCYLYMSPQTNAGLGHILERDGCACKMCGIDWEDAIEESRKKVLILCDQRIHDLLNSDMYKQILKPEVIKKYIGNWQKTKESLLDKGINAEVVREFKLLIPKEESPEIDHVIPVALGGEIVGFNNLQIICKSCHSKKTIEDLKLIRLGK